MLTDERNASLLRTENVVDQATGVLVLALQVSPRLALAHLTDAATRHDVTRLELAEVVVAVASGIDPADPRLRNVLYQEWGDLLL